MKLGKKDFAEGIKTFVMFQMELRSAIYKNITVNSMEECVAECIGSRLREEFKCRLTLFSTNYYVEVCNSCCLCLFSSVPDVSFHQQAAEHDFKKISCDTQQELKTIKRSSLSNVKIILLLITDQ